MNSYSDNQRQSVAVHETGHAHSIGHISGTAIALMGYNPDPNVYFTPQQPDIDLINKVYP